MNLCLGKRLDAPGWTGLPLGHFAPSGHDAELPVAATQDTLFIWNDGASPAVVRTQRGCTQYERRNGVIDLMATDEEAFIRHVRPQAPGDCLLVGIPVETREALGIGGGPRMRHAQLGSRFGFTDALIHAAARSLEQQCREGEPLGRLFTESISTALVTLVVGRYAGKEAPGAPVRRSLRGTLTATQQARLLRYVDERLDADIGLTAMADCCGYSPSHFLRVFARTFGTSPYQFVLARRLERAQWMLRGDVHSLADIASACGFADQSHFTATFARRVGTTPGRWRLQARG